MKKFLLFYVTSIIILVYATSLTAQIPQYYNGNTASNSNSFPFNVPGGKAVNWLIRSGELVQPTPIPTGKAITTVYFRTSTVGSRDFTDLHILMAQSSITDLTSGTFYAGPWDTVYNHPTTTLSSTAGGWMSITLDHSFNYDPAQSLLIFVGQCGATGSGISIYQQDWPGTRRVWSNGGCPFTPYTSADSRVLDFGVDVVDAGTNLCSKFDNSWAPSNTYPSLPGATYFNSSAWIGNDLYVHAPNSSGAASTDIFKYTLAETWTIGVPCLTAVTGASMTECGGKLYLIGGGTSTVTVGSTNVQEFNPATNTWIAKAPLPVALSAHGSVCWGDSVIFVVGGPYTGSGTNLNVYYYRPATDTWGTITNSLPSGQGRRTFALGITNGNKIVMSCGYNSGFLKSTYIGTIGANATQITWTAAADAPVALSRCAGAYYDNTFFLIGGDTNNTDVKNTKVFLLDVNGNIWDKVILNNPNPVSNMCNAVTASCFNDTIRVFQPGGHDGFIGIDNFNITGHGNIFVGINPSTGSNTAKNILEQNFPNPFFNTTTIKYQLHSNSYVILKVFDIMGKEIRTLVNAYQTTGTYNVTLDASDLTAGIYVYQLTTNELSISKRMIIEK